LQGFLIHQQWVLNDCYKPQYYENHSDIIARIHDDENYGPMSYSTGGSRDKAPITVQPGGAKAIARLE
jgi:hypothetical protein